LAVPDQRFHDLVGNVAEWVTDPLANGRPTTFYVIGGSALSSAPAGDECRKKRLGTKGAPVYSDVGFRLAFTAPVPSLAESLALKLRSGDYYAKEPGAASASTVLPR
jgi:hypothetical protein